MVEETPNEELPLLIARFANEGALDFLTGTAMAEGAVYVPLVTGPTSSSLHTLQVHVTGRKDFLVLLAEPLGPRDPKGYPLRLRMPAAPPRPSVRRVAAETVQQASDNDDASHSSPPVSVRAGLAAKDPFIGRQLAGGKLLIEACVGEGGAGSVYRARHRDLQMSVAVKFMHEAYQRDPDYCRRFHSEALSASRLDHANLTRVLDFGQEPDGILYIAMEFLDGKSLREILEVDKMLSFERAAQIMVQVCSGLTHAHARSIVHRDIKPENLMLVRGLDENGIENEIVKICDFGIAHQSAVDAQAGFAGTAEYIAPELFQGAEPDVQSDVYACGVVLYELLCGVVPIEGDFPEITDLVLNTAPKPPSARVGGVDARIDRLVMKALSKDREIRHASARELRTELKQTAEDIALFSAGGYWDGVAGAVGSGSSPAPARPSVSSEGEPDWLERGNGYLSSMMPPSNSGPPSERSASPAPTSPPASRGGMPGRPSVTGMPAVTGRPSHPNMPSMRAQAPSYADQGTPSMRASQLGIASLPPRRPSGPPSAEGTGPSIMPGSHVSMTPPAMTEADETARVVGSFLKTLLATTDGKKFGELVAPIAPKIRHLVEQGYIVPAWKLASALDMISGEPPGPDSRAEHAKRALEIFADRAVLVSIAEKALDALHDRDGIARKMVVRAGNAGAHALYSARVKHSVFEARERFVTTMLEIGGEALPTLRTGLERLESRLSVPGALWIAEDLIKAVPLVRDDQLGQCLARYAKSQTPSLALLATEALPNAWGPKARSLLLAQLHHREDDVAIAAMKRLRQLGGVDLEVLAQLRSLVLGSTGSRPPVRLAATEALVDSTQDALPSARALLAETLAATQGTTPDADDMVVMVSNTIVTIKADMTLVAERWRTSTGFLRKRLELILQRARQ